MRVSCLLSLLLLGAGCGGGGDGPKTDGGSGQDASDVCNDDRACDDGLFCNGSEACIPDAPDADARGCVTGTPPCEEDEPCDEDREVCGACSEQPDMDGDGHDAIACGGDDCDDTDPRRFPGNTEVCDAEGHDEDCDPTTFGPDEDGDGYVSQDCCNTQEDGSLECGRDCDDGRSGVHPEAVDGCGGGDEDCDGIIDEEPSLTFYRDVDGDGFGVSDDTVTACSRPDGYAFNPGDCDDMASGIHPGAEETCDGLDNDCSGTVDDPSPPAEPCDCTDGDERTCGPPEAGTGICKSGTQVCVSGGWSSECTGAVYPETETCGGGDEDCDGMVDEGGASDADLWYPDADGDGYGDASAEPVSACSADRPTDPSHVMDNRDCDDSAADVNPGEEERCDRIDTDCSEGGGSAPWEDRDDDGYSPHYADCTGGWEKTDCNDGDSRAHPGAGFQDTSWNCCPSGWERIDCSTSPEDRCVPAGEDCSYPYPTVYECGAWADTYDYDCDGTEEPEYPRTAESELCPAEGCDSEGLVFSCSSGDVQYSYSGVPCGSMIERHFCTKNIDGFTCDCPGSVESTDMITLRCK